MMYKSTTLLLLSGLLVTNQVAFAQDAKPVPAPAAASTPAPTAKAPSLVKWKMNFPKTINWMHVAPVGTLVMATDDGLYGANSQTGKLAWSANSLKNVKMVDCDFIPNSSYLTVVKSDGYENPVTDHTMIDVLTGRVVFNSTKLGYKTVMKRVHLSELGAVILFGINKDFKPLATCINATTGEVVWSKTDLFRLSETVVSEPLLVNEDAFIIATTAGIYRIATFNGAVAWFIEQRASAPAVKMSENIGKTLSDAVTAHLLMENSHRVFYYITDDQVIGYKMEDGRNVWPKPLALSGEFKDLWFDKNGLIIATGGKKSTINLYDYFTGEGRWLADKTPAPVTFAKYYDKNFIYVMSKSGSKSGVNMVETGTGRSVVGGGSGTGPKCKIPGEIEQIEMTSKGIFYKTDKELDIIGYESGEKSLTIPLKVTTEKAVTATNSLFIYVYLNKQLYVIDKRTGSIKQLSQKEIQFEGGETPQSIELRKSGILLQSASNLTLIDYNKGSEIYHTYNAGFAATTYTESEDHAMVPNYQKNIPMWGGLSDVAKQALVDRKKKSSEISASCIMSSTKAGPNNTGGNGVLKVSKISGKQVGAYLTKGTQLDVIKDEAGKVSFIKNDLKQIICIPL